MSIPPQQPVFLQRARYRRRRLRDAARMMPVVGVVLFLIPLLWPEGRDTPNAFAVQYVFGAWAFLVVLAAFISHRMRRHSDEDTPV
jgi:hypothetical protein